MSSNNSTSILQYFPSSPYINYDNYGYYDLVLRKLTAKATNSSSSPYLKSSLSSVYSGIVTTRHEILDMSYVSPVSWALLGAFTLWFVFLLSLAIWRRNYQPVKARDIFLMIVSIVATYFVSLMVTLRFAFGRYEFPCFFFTFLLLLAYPGLFLPAILRCWRLIFVYLISKKKQLITSYNERRQSLVMKRQSPSQQPIFTKTSQQVQSVQSSSQPSSQPTSPLSTTELLDTNNTIMQSVSELGTPTAQPQSSANNSNSILTEDETTTTDNDEARNVAELDDDDLDIEAIEIPNLDHEGKSDAPSGKTVVKKLDLFAKLSSKAALSTILAVVYMIHFAVFVILILTDLGYYTTRPFLQGCFTDTKVYAVLVLTLVYYVTSITMLIIIWRKVKENWFIRREVFVVMLFWMIDVLIFFIAGIWGSYNLIYEHYFPAGWIILFGCLFDNVVSCLIPIILSFQTSKYQWNDGSENGNSIEVREILRDKNARTLFKEFATESFVPEGILFWEDAHAFLKIKSKEKKKKFANTIITKYIKYGSNLELNLPNRSVWEKEIMEHLDKKKIPDSIFYKLVEHVERDLMDIFVRYKRTNEYKRSKTEIEEKKKELEAQKQVVIAFPVPTCTTSTSFPQINPIPSNVTTIKMCYDGASYIVEPWPSIYKSVGNGIVKYLNSQYKLQLTASYVLVNTEDGYFSSLKKAVDTAVCDIAVADTTITADRSTQVHFAKCPYGSTANGFLRNDLDNGTVVISSFSDLNNANVKVRFYQGTIFETIANQSLPLAQKIPSTYDGQFDLLTSRKVHAILGDGIDLLQWKSNNLKSCSSCFVKIFGDSAPFGVFTQISTRTNGALLLTPSFVILISTICLSIIFL